MDKIKIKVSSFVVEILENDALSFGFIKNGNANKNALLNKLIPTLVAMRQARREEIRHILKNEYQRHNIEDVYQIANTVIDRVYFNDDELSDLSEALWIRPTKEAHATFDEIQTSEAKITTLEPPSYIRGLLHEYVRFPSYKRETLLFYNELDTFLEGCSTQQIFHFRNRMTGSLQKVLPVVVRYGYLYDQTNYCIIYDITNKKICAIPLYLISDAYLLKQKFKPSNALIEKLQAYDDECDYSSEIFVEEI